MNLVPSSGVLCPFLVPSLSPCPLSPLLPLGLGRCLLEQGRGITQSLWGKRRERVSKMAQSFLGFCSVHSPFILSVLPRGAELTLELGHLPDEPLAPPECQHPAAEPGEGVGALLLHAPGVTQTHIPLAAGPAPHNSSREGVQPPPPGTCVCHSALRGD